MKHVVLVACALQKHLTARPARDLYRSQLFIKNRAYAEHLIERDGGEWFILSAKHGLVHPAQVIESYNESVTTMRREERFAWANWVFNTLWSEYRCIYKAREFVLLAGDTYREFLVPMIERNGVSVNVPMAKLSIGEQLRWLNRAMAVNA